MVTVAYPPGIVEADFQGPVSVYRCCCTSEDNGMLKMSQRLPCNKKTPIPVIIDFLVYRLVTPGFKGNLVTQGNR